MRSMAFKFMWQVFTKGQRQYVILYIIFMGSANHAYV